jgi:hypothetical protein
MYPRQHQARSAVHGDQQERKGKRRIERTEKRDRGERPEGRSLRSTASTVLYSHGVGRWVTGDLPVVVLEAASGIKATSEYCYYIKFCKI